MGIEAQKSHFCVKLLEVMTTGKKTTDVSGVQYYAISCCTKLANS